MPNDNGYSTCKHGNRMDQGCPFCDSENDDDDNEDDE